MPTCAVKVALGPSSDVVCAARDKNSIRSVPNRPSRMTSACRPRLESQSEPWSSRGRSCSARKSLHVSILPMSSAAIRPPHTSRCQRAPPPTRCRFFAQKTEWTKYITVSSKIIILSISKYCSITSISLPSR